MNTPMRETQPKMETGKYYWVMLNQYHDWQPGYVGEDHDGNQWLHLTGVSTPFQIEELTELIYRELTPPPSITQPIPRD